MQRKITLTLGVGSTPPANTRSTERARGGRAYSSVDCLGRLTIDRVSLSRRSGRGGGEGAPTIAHTLPYQCCCILHQSTFFPHILARHVLSWLVCAPTTMSLHYRTTFTWDVHLRCPRPGGILIWDRTFSWDIHLAQVNTDGCLRSLSGISGRYGAFLLGTAIQPEHLSGI